MTLKDFNFPRPPNVSLLRVLWSLLDGIWGVLKGSWGVLVVIHIYLAGIVMGYRMWPNLYGSFSA